MERGAAFLKPRTSLIPNNDDEASWLYYIVYIFILSYTFIILFGELCLPWDERAWCTAANLGYPPKTYENPDYITNPCHYERVWQLFFLNKDEIDFARRMLCSVLLGATIGYERKTSERPAGIRTMSLVSLGSCVFTVCSQRAFRSSTMTWDAARVSAAIPAGVGFLGAALIWKSKETVRGLTTAGGIWLAAAVGLGAGGRLFVVATYATALVVVVLRMGPQLYLVDDESYLNDETQSSTDNDEDWNENDSNAGSTNEGG